MANLYNKIMLFLLVVCLIISPFISIAIITTEFGDGEILANIAIHTFTCIDMAIIICFIVKKAPKWIANHKRAFTTILLLFCATLVLLVCSVAINKYKQNQFSLKVNRLIQDRKEKIAYSVYRNVELNDTLSLTFDPDNITNRYDAENNIAYINVLFDVKSNVIDDRAQKGESDLIKYMQRVLNYIDDVDLSSNNFEYNEDGIVIKVAYSIPFKNNSDEKKVWVYSESGDQFKMSYSNDWISIYKNNDLLYIERESKVNSSSTYINSLPFEGMSEDNIYNTKLGSPDEVEDCIDFYRLNYRSRSRKYTWYLDGEKSTSWKNLAIATVRYDENGDGYVSSFTEYHR